MTSNGLSGDAVAPIEGFLGQAPTRENWKCGAEGVTIAYRVVGCFVAVKRATYRQTRDEDCG